MKLQWDHDNCVSDKDHILVKIVVLIMIVMIVIIIIVMAIKIVRN